MVQMLKTFVGAAVVGSCAVILTGCGADETTTSTTMTTTITTTSTTTTMHGPDGETCPGQKDVGYIFGTSQACFCLYTFNCFDHKDADRKLDFSKCKDLEHSVNNDMTECQMNQCGKSTIDHNEFTTSFENIHQTQTDHDMLTIPNMWIQHIGDLHTECDNNGTSLLVQMLKDGRAVFKKHYNKDADWQCIHLPNKIAVKWLHLHTFVGHVRSEGMPGVYPNATCVKISPTSKPEDDEKTLIDCEYKACEPGVDTHEVTETVI